jgi:hypothetical protein
MARLSVLTLLIFCVFFCLMLPAVAKDLTLPALLTEAQKAQETGRTEEALGTLVTAHRAYPASREAARRLESLVSAGLPPRLESDWLAALPVNSTSLPYDLGMVIVPKPYLPTHAEEPQHGWSFAKVAYVYSVDAESPRLFCAVHYPSEASGALAGRVARLLALAHQTLTRKTGQEAANGTAPFNVWLCTGGQSGGEQWRDNLYLYDLETPRSSIEWLRETVHEYAHLALPAVGGYQAPEYWANGYLGERLLVRWLERSPDGPAHVEAVWGDFSGASNFNRLLIAPPLALYKKIGPSPAWLARRDELGMRYLIGQALTFDDKYGAARLGDAFRRLPRFREATAQDFAASLSESLSASAHLRSPQAGP